MTTAIPALPQDADEVPGADFFLDFSTGILASDNLEDLEDPSGTSVVSQTDVALTFDTRTRADRFTTQIGGRYEAGDFADDPDGGGFLNPFIDVDYNRTNRTSALSFGARYQERDNGFSTDDVENSADLIVDQGTRADTRLDATLELGQGGPTSFTGSLRFDDRRFFDTTDPDLTDQERYEINGTLSLLVARNTRLNFSARYSERDEDNAADTFEVNSGLGIGLTTTWANGVELDSLLEFARNEETETIDGDRDTDVTEEPRLQFSLERPVTNGTIFTTLEQELNSDGGRTNLSFGRSLSTRFGGTLRASAGVTVGEDDDELRGIASVQYNHELPRGRLGFNFSSSVVNDDDDGDVIRGDLGLSWDRSLTELSTFSLRMNVSASDAVDPDETDRSRTQVEVAYRRQLTEDWNFNTGYRYGISRESDRDPIIENEVFANIGRRFTFRP